MREFLQECYVGAGRPSVARRIQQRIEATAADMTALGVRVHLVRSMLVPADETWFLLWEAETDAAVREVAVRAGVACDRLTEVVALPPTSTGRG